MKPTHAKIIGIGGIHCSCCRNHGSRKDCRIAVNRIIRRKERQKLKGNKPNE